MASMDVGAHAAHSTQFLQFVAERDRLLRARELIDARGHHPDGGYSPICRDPDYIAKVGMRLAHVEELLEESSRRVA